VPHQTRASSSFQSNFLGLVQFLAFLSRKVQSASTIHFISTLTTELEISSVKFESSRRHHYTYSKTDSTSIGETHEGHPTGSSSHQYLLNMQWGFCPGKSATCVLLAATDIWHQWLDSSLDRLYVQ